MLMVPWSGIPETLKKMSVVAVLCYSGFDMALGYMAYFRSCDVDWTWRSSSWVP